jgi:hypothetical protein
MIVVPLSAAPRAPTAALSAASGRSPRTPGGVRSALSPTGETPPGRRQGDKSKRRCAHTTPPHFQQETRQRFSQFVSSKNPTSTRCSCCLSHTPIALLLGLAACCRTPLHITHHCTTHTIVHCIPLHTAHHCTLHTIAPHTTSPHTIAPHSIAHRTTLHVVAAVCSASYSMQCCLFANIHALLVLHLPMTGHAMRGYRLGALPYYSLQCLCPSSTACHSHHCCIARTLEPTCIRARTLVPSYLHSRSHLLPLLPLLLPLLPLIYPATP